MALRLLALLIIAVLAGCDQQRSVTVHTPAGLAYRANGGLFHCSPRSTCTFEFPASLDLQDEYILAEAGGHRFAGWRAAQEGALCSHHELARCIHGDPGLLDGFGRARLSVWLLDSASQADASAPRQAGRVTLNTRTTVRYYQVAGATFDEILEQTESQRNPLYDGSGEAMNVAESDISTTHAWELEESRGRRCPVSSGEVTVEMLVTLPALANPGALDEGSLSEWRHYYLDTIAHEATHLDISRESARVAAGLLDTIRGSCSNSNRFNARIERKLAAIEDYEDYCHRQFHQVTRAGEEDTAAFTGSLANTNQGTTSADNCLHTLRGRR